MALLIKDNAVKSDFSTRKLMNYRTELFGFSAIWIVVFHVYSYIGFLSGNVVFHLISRILSVGNMGVDLFLFFSSVGLCYSLSKNRIKDYYLNRVNRVVLPYFLLAIVFFIWYDFMFFRSGLLVYLLNVTTLNFWHTGDHPTWYVAFIIIMYAIFPLIYKIDKNTSHLSTIMLIIISIVWELFAMRNQMIFYQNCERALSRIPIFLIGIIAYDIINKDRKNTSLDCCYFVIVRCWWLFCCWSYQFTNYYCKIYLWGNLNLLNHFLFVD